MYYAYARLSSNDLGICRIPISGIGLGNLLFPWARLMVAAKNYGLKPICPTWLQIRFGPFLRGEKDKRFYHNLFDQPKGQIGGLRKLYLLSQVPRMTEEDFLARPRTDLRDAIVVYEGARDCFRTLNGWNGFLYREIRSMTRKCWLDKVNQIGSIPIGVHVRRGDLSQTKSATPIEWFIECLNIVRRAVGFPVKVVIVSDGSDEELKDLLGVKNVHRVACGSAIADLLVLSKAKILIASGGSTFSAWASFLGQMPVVSYPGQPLAWFKLINRRGLYVGEFDPTSPDGLFIDQVKAVLTHKVLA